MRDGSHAQTFSVPFETSYMNLYTVFSLMSTGLGLK